MTITKEELVRLIEQKKRSFNNIDLSGMDLCGINFSKADLSGANFSESILARAYFPRATLARTNFQGADLVTNGSTTCPVRARIRRPSPSDYVSRRRRAPRWPRQGR